MYPMVRARMTAINATPVESIKLKGEGGRNFLEREQNLTWAAALMDDNQLIAGHWWTTRETTANRWCPYRPNIRKISA
jgi:putative ABC transport system permease protein